MNDLWIEIRKSEKKLLLFKDKDPVRSFDVVFGFAPKGPKEIEGDGKTPEGGYFVCVKNPKSKFHLSVGLNYPNEVDAGRGLASGLITQSEHDAIVDAVNAGRMPPQDTSLGGEIYIHGGGTKGNWTRGCIALGDPEMTDLYELTRVGTAVRILP